MLELCSGIHQLLAFITHVAVLGPIETMMQGTQLNHEP